MRRVWALLFALLLPVQAFGAALLNFGGFEGQASEGTFNTSGTFSYSTSIKRTGATSLRVNPTTTAIGYVAYAELSAAGANLTAFTGTAQDTLYIEFRWCPVTLPAANSEEILRIDATAGNTPASVRVTSGGKLAVYRDFQAGTLVATGSTTVTAQDCVEASDFYRIGFLVNSGASGAYEVRINGVTELSGTADFLTEDFESVEFGKVRNINGQSVEYYYDDWAVSSAGWPGNIEVVQAKPIANGATAQWTGGTNSSNYAEVDETTPDNTDYIASLNAAGTKVHYVTLQSSSTLGIAGTIRALKAYMQVRETAFAFNTSTTLRIRSSSSNSDNTAIDTIGATTTRYRVINTDPATTEAWLKANFDNVNIGVVEANTGITRCNWLGAMVAYDSETAEPSTGIPGARLLLGVG